jgi:hypothetical protein
MKKNRDQRPAARRFAPLGIVLALAGVVLFGYLVNKAGVAEIMAGIKRLGAGFLLIVAISAVRLVVRALAWTRCVEGPQRLKLRDAFQARIMGDALGNLLPLGAMVVSEPSKAVLLRDRLPLMTALSSLAVENIFYSLSVALFVFSGTAALLLSFALPDALRIASYAALAIIAAITAMVFLAIRKQWKFLSGSLHYLYRRGWSRGWLDTKRARVDSFEDRIYGFYRRNQGQFLPIIFLEACFHMAGVAEIYVTLSFISEAHPPTLLTGFILESVNRVINIVFKFMPLRTGVDEAGTGLLARILGFGTTIGVTLAIVRKARDIFWTAIGVGLLIHRGLSPRAIAEETEAVAEEVGSSFPSSAAVRAREAEEV